MRHLYTPAKGEHKLFSPDECEEMTDVTFTRYDHTYWIGDAYVIEAGVPGAGKIEYKISRITEDGVYGTYMSGAFYELDIEDVM